jgi:hypothetical protein
MRYPVQVMAGAACFSLSLVAYVCQHLMTIGTMVAHRLSELTRS